MYFIVLAICVAVAFAQTCHPNGLSVSGVCQDVTIRGCEGQYYRGACPGSKNIQCCVPSTGKSSGPSGSGASGWGTYQPPASARSSLGHLFSSVNPTRVNWGYKGAKATFMLPGGAFFFESKMDTDCDGAPSCPSIDPSGQRQTSYTWSGAPIDALKTNYFVLPSNLKGRLGNTKLGLGDIAAVIYNGKLEFAIYADNGPNDKIGEGSVKLVQNLGFNPYSSNGKICCGISSGVIVIVFPGSRGTYTSPYNRESVRSAGLAKLNALTGGNALAISGSESMFDSGTQSDNTPASNAVIAVAAIVACITVVIVVVMVVKYAKTAQHEQP